MPMVIDGGRRGLEQSRYHPNAGLGATNPSERVENGSNACHTPQEEIHKEAYEKLASLVPEGCFQGV